MSETPPRKTASPPKATWDDQIEQLFESWHRRVAAAEIGHRLMSDRMRNRSLALGIPVVVLTTVIGTSVFASLQKEHVSTAIRIAVGSISILAAVLSSLQTFMRYSTRAEGHLSLVPPDPRWRGETITIPETPTAAVAPVSRATPTEGGPGER